jgi:predicted acyl esterase
MSHRLAYTWLYVALFMCFTGCSSLNNGTGIPNDPGSGQPPTELTTAVDGALPSLDALPAAKTVSAPPDPSFSIIGRANQAVSGNAVEVGDSISLPSGATEISWALYGVGIEYIPGGNITPYMAPYGVNINTDGGGEYYFALADFKRDRWNIHPTLYSGEENYIEIGLEPNAADVQGGVWFAIITFGGEAIQVEIIDFYYPDGPPADDDPVDYHQWIIAEDGTRLATNIYMPRDPLVLWAPPYPVALLRTPYNKNNVTLATIKSQTDANIAVVVQYFRGRFDDTGDWPDSDGTETMFKDHAGPEHADALDTVAWIEGRNWYNGSLVTGGYSAIGLWQYQAATQLGDRLLAMYPQISAGNVATWGALRNGCFKRGNIGGWIEAHNYPPALYDEIIANFETPSYWDDVDFDAQASGATCPAYHETGWWDVDVDATINSWRELQENGGDGAAGNQYLLIGPWDHSPFRPTTVGSLDFPTGDAQTDPSIVGASWDGTMWIASVLGRNPLFTPPTNHVKVYFIGGEGNTNAPQNHWYEFDDWPPAYTDRVFYIDDDTVSLTSLEPEAGTFNRDCDPANPVPTIGGAHLPFPPTIESGPYSQAIAEMHPDVLRMESGLLLTPMSFAGPVKVKLWVSTDAVDTDIMVKLIDNYPGGEDLLVADSALRLSWYLNKYTIFPDVTPGQVYEVNLELSNVAYVFDSGHKIILNVQSTNYPRFARNPGNGDPFYDETNGQVQHNTLYFGGERLSRLILPRFDPSA